MMYSQEALSQLLICSKNWLYAFMVLLFGYLSSRFLINKISVNFKAKMSPQHLLIVRKSILYTLWIATIIVALQQIGLSLTGVFGVAGILSVAIGFAAQTSIANIISGLFLFFEQPFVIGDIIKIREHTGKVQSIDLLSVKMITPDHTLLRIPNESMIRADIINLSYNVKAQD